MRRRSRPGTNPSPGLEERCAERVRSLGLPLHESLTVEEICEHIGALRQRPVRVVPLPRISLHGLLVSTEANDYIFVDKRLVPVHRQQVLLHEIGHVVCDHETSSTLIGDASRVLFPSLDPDLILRVVGRDHTDSDAEIEAEMVGSLIGQRISTWTTQRTWPVPPEAQEIADRLTALEPPVPWRKP